MIVYPAIDLYRGRCVRMRRGREEETTVYPDPPLEVARRYVEQGAQFLHLIDLEGALNGGVPHLALIAQLIRKVEVPVQVGGGFRSLDRIEALFEAGAARVVVGSVLIDQPEVVDEAVREVGSERLVLAIDIRRGRVVGPGWREVTPVRPADLASRAEALGLSRVILTDTDRDGTLEGINLQATRALAESTSLGVIAAGGIGSMEDLSPLKELEAIGVEGVVLGKALLDGTVKLAEAIRFAHGY